MTVKAVKAVTPSKPQTKPNTAAPSTSQATNAAPTATFKTDGYTNKCTDANAGSNILKMEGDQVKPTDADTRAIYTKQ